MECLRSVLGKEPATLRCVWSVPLFTPERNEGYGWRLPAADHPVLSVVRKLLYAGDGIRYGSLSRAVLFRTRLVPFLNSSPYRGERS